MALEQVPEKSKGDPLYAAEVNVLSAVAGRVSKNVSDGSTVLRDFEYKRPGKQRSLQVVEITRAMDTDEATDPEGLFWCALRFYDTESAGAVTNDGEWLTDVRGDPGNASYSEDYEYALDARGVSSAPAVGDKISAWWDIEGQAFIPASSPGIKHAWGTTTAAVATTDASFTVSSVVPFDGSTWPGTGNLYVKNDGYKIASGSVGKIVYCYDGTTGNAHNYDGTTENAPDGWNWHTLDFAIVC